MLIIHGQNQKALFLLFHVLSNLQGRVLWRIFQLQHSSKPNKTKPQKGDHSMTCIKRDAIKMIINGLFKHSCHISDPILRANIPANLSTYFLVLFEMTRDNQGSSVSLYRILILFCKWTFPIPCTRNSPALFHRGASFCFIVKEKQNWKRLFVRSNCSVLC